MAPLYLNHVKFFCIVKIISEEFQTGKGSKLGNCWIKIVLKRLKVATYEDSMTKNKSKGSEN